MSDSVVLAARERLIANYHQRQLFPRFEVIAEDLNISSRTLRRKLKDKGFRYQEIKDAVRCDMAIELLASSKNPVEVSDALGFRDVSGFCRAFKRWTGLTPKQYFNNN